VVEDELGEGYDDGFACLGLLCCRGAQDSVMSLRALDVGGKMRKGKQRFWERRLLRRITLMFDFKSLHS
jgi:hypothetical protein